MNFRRGLVVLIRTPFQDLTVQTQVSVKAGQLHFYDRHRAAGDTHYQALRALSNRWVGILHGCLRHRTAYHQQTAWGQATTEQSAAA